MSSQSFRSGLYPVVHLVVLGFVLQSSSAGHFIEGRAIALLGLLLCAVAYGGKVERGWWLRVGVWGAVAVTLLAFDDALAIPAATVAGFYALGLAVGMPASSLLRVGVVAVGLRGLLLSGTLRLADDHFGRWLVSRIGGEAVSLDLLCGDWLTLGTAMVLILAGHALATRSRGDAVRLAVVTVTIIAGTAVSAWVIHPAGIACAVLSAGLALPPDREAQAPAWAVAASAAAAIFGLAIAGADPLRVADPLGKADRRLHIGLITGLGTMTRERGPYTTDNLPIQADFSEIPRVLSRYGHEVTLLDRSWGAKELSRLDVLCVVNAQQPPTATQRSLLERFLREGGGMVALGDHTDIMGIQGPLNDYLAPTAIRYRFDSAVPNDDSPGWHRGLVAARYLPQDYANAGKCSLSVGASLEVKPPARVLLSGRNGFADRGDRAAKPGHLGNMRYERGEPFGMLPLVAEQAIGRGRVVVWGDTSTFQAGSLAASFPVVLNTFQRAAAPPGPHVPPFLFFAVAVASLTLVALQSGPFVQALVLAAGLAPASLGTRIPAPVESTRRDTAVLHVRNAPAYPTIHEGEQFERAKAVLRRADYSVYVDDQLDRKTLDAALILIVAPTLPYSPKDVQALKRYVTHGGTLLVSAGAQHEANVRALLGTFGVSVGRAPLGGYESKLEDPSLARLTPVPMAAQFRLVDAYPISGAGRVLATTLGKPSVLEQRCGKGTLIVIADSRFLLDKNLGERQSVNLPAATFLFNLLPAIEDRRPVSDHPAR